MTDPATRALGREGFWRHGAFYPLCEVQIGHGGSLSVYHRDPDPEVWFSGHRETLHTFNIRSADRDYWRSTKAFLFWLGAGMGAWPKLAYKDLRRQHIENQRKDWEAVLPEEICRWASGVLRRKMSELDCCDNDRVALMSNSSQMRRYRAALKDGCCGFYDEVHVGPDGNRYLVGFNFGH